MKASETIATRLLDGEESAKDFIARHTQNGRLGLIAHGVSLNTDGDRFTFSHKLGFKAVLRQTGIESVWDFTLIGCTHEAVQRANRDTGLTALISAICKVAKSKGIEFIRLPKNLNWSFAYSRRLKEQSTEVRDGGNRLVYTLR